MVGSDNVGGAATTHIRAGVNVNALLADVNTFLAKAAQPPGSSKIPSSIPQAAQQQIAAAIKNATVDIWTGKSDHTLRKLALNLNVPVSGQGSTLAGASPRPGSASPSSTRSSISPSRFRPPPTVHPYSEFATKLRSLL